MGRFGAWIKLNYWGARCVPAKVALEHLVRQWEWCQRHASEVRQITEELASSKARWPAGVPAQEGLIAAEVMMAQPGDQSPHDEFGRPKPNFIVEQLDAGARGAGRAIASQRGAERSISPRRCGTTSQANREEDETGCGVPGRSAGGSPQADRWKATQGRTGSDHRKAAGPHSVGQAEVLQDGRLALWLAETTEPGRTARALLADDILDMVLVGSEPTIRLQVPRCESAGEYGPPLAGPACNNVPRAGAPPGTLDRSRLSQSSWGTGMGLACDPVVVTIEARHISIKGEVEVVVSLRRCPGGEVSTIDSITGIRRSRCGRCRARG